MPTTECPHGHEIHSAADRDSQSYCLQCRRFGARTYRSRQRAALELALALESFGIEVTRSDPPVDLRRLAADLASAFDSEAQ